jgi:16S rRNA (guanine(966)-N(2))-methyltransferase RsmD
MRVIAGAAKGRKLLSVPGEGTRPITDRAKEALFSILQPDLPEARFLDLFAGTGGVGIEALSRGAAWADFVESGAAAFRVLRENVDHTGFARVAALHRRDVFDYLAGRPQAYDFVYIAPPQYKELWSRTLAVLDKTPDWVAAGGGTAIVQIHPREARELELGHFTLEQVRRYGSVELRFYVRTA